MCAAEALLLPLSGLMGRGTTRTFGATTMLEDCAASGAGLLMVASKSLTFR